MKVQGYFQIYTGDGKGKTTAAVGLAVRAAGAGLKVEFIQFLKTGDSSEIKTLKKISGITVNSFGSGKFLIDGPRPEDKEQARAGLDYVEQIVLKQKCDVLIMDEICCAVYFGLLTGKSVLDVIGERPDGMEVIATGRNASKRFIKIADLVTEMTPIKHYYDKGVVARDGIEK